MLSLPPLPAEVEVGGRNRRPRRSVADFAEQFSMDVSGISWRTAGAVVATLGDGTSALWC